MSDVNFLGSVALFRDWAPADLAVVASHLVARSFKAGEVILTEGEPNHSLHLLREGRARVSRQVEQSDAILADLNAGQTFGELSILGDGIATATLTAIVDCATLSLDRDDLTAVLASSPEAAAHFWKAIALDLRRRLVQTNDVVRSYFEINRALVDNPTFREVYALCIR